MGKIYHDNERTDLRIDLSIVIYISDVIYPFLKKPYIFLLTKNDVKIKTSLRPPKNKIEYLLFWRRIKQIRASRLWFFENWIRIQKGEEE